MAADGPCLFDLWSTRCGQGSGRNLLLSGKKTAGWEEWEVEWGRVQMSIGETSSDVSIILER